MTTKYLFLGDRRISSKDSSGTLLFFHEDHINSSNVITDASGNQAALYEYDPYGSTVTHTGSVDVKHRFTGQEADDTTRLYYYNARYYDPQLGRFATADWIVQDPSDPQALNRYAYARNNPIVFTDPTGNFFWFIAAAIAAIAHAAAAAAAAVASAIVSAVSTIASTIGGVLHAVGASILHGLNAIGGFVTGSGTTGIVPATGGGVVTETGVATGTQIAEFGTVLSTSNIAVGAVTVATTSVGVGLSIKQASQALASNSPTIKMHFSENPLSEARNYNPSWLDDVKDSAGSPDIKAPGGGPNAGGGSFGDAGGGPVVATPITSPGSSGPATVPGKPLDVVEEVAPDILKAEHTKGARPSTEEKHQRAEARRRRDKRGEKKEKHGRMTHPPKKFGGKRYN